MIENIGKNDFTMHKIAGGIGSMVLRKEHAAKNTNSGEML